LQGGAGAAVGILQLLERFGDLEWVHELASSDVPRRGAPVRRYRSTDRYELGDVVLHGQFGTGVVTRTEQTRIHVRFATEAHLLVHGVPAR
jgi:hypothetical protein